MSKVVHYSPFIFEMLGKCYNEQILYKHLKFLGYQIYILTDRFILYRVSIYHHFSSKRSL